MKSLIDYKHIIYFGGNFEFQYKDYTRELLAQDYRAKVLGDVEKLMRRPKDDFGYIELSDEVLYSGPYYFYEDGVDGASIVKNEFNMVVRSTDVVFLLDNVNCPGTIAEMMHALFSNKRIWIFYVSQPQDEGEPEKEISNSNWYPIEMCRWQRGGDRCKITECSSRADAVNKIVEFINGL